MSTQDVTVLLIGYGNPARLDDGLGPALAERVEAQALAGVTVECNYQLNIEDAADLAGYDVVIFADAHVSCPEPFEFRCLAPVEEITFTTHSIQPPSLLALAQQTFAAKTVGFALGIRGYNFNDFGEGLSEKAASNLDAALTFLVPLLRGRDLCGFQAACHSSDDDSIIPSNGDQICKTVST